MEIRDLLVTNKNHLLLMNDGSLQKTNYPDEYITKTDTSTPEFTTLLGEDYSRKTNIMVDRSLMYHAKTHQWMDVVGADYQSTNGIDAQGIDQARNQYYQFLECDTPDEYLMSQDVERLDDLAVSGQYSRWRDLHWKRAQEDDDLGFEPATDETGRVLSPQEVIDEIKEMLVEVDEDDDDVIPIDHPDYDYDQMRNPLLWRNKEGETVYPEVLERYADALQNNQPVDDLIKEIEVLASETPVTEVGVPIEKERKWIEETLGCSYEDFKDFVSGEYDDDGRTEVVCK